MKDYPYFMAAYRIIVTYCIVESNTLCIFSNGPCMSKVIYDIIYIYVLMSNIIYMLYVNVILYVVYVIIIVFQKLEQLRLRSLTPSPTALERFCEAMPHITKLDLSVGLHTKGCNHKHGYDGVLRAIAANMPHLMHLDISYCTVKPKAIEHLLPTEDNALRGCSELVELVLFGIITVDVKLLN